MSVSVIGAGAFGLSTACALRSRGHSVRVFDAAGPPAPLASSTDLSKLVRMDYGRDRFLQDLMAAAMPRWDAWNRTFERPLYHETGLAVLSRSPLAPGGFEHDSRQGLRAAGLAVEDLDDVSHRLPAWRGHVAGYINPRAGWAESGRVVAALADRVEVEVARVADPTVLEADRVVVAAGVWSLLLVPELAARARIVGQPVLHFLPREPDLFRPPHFLPWASDIAETGWYGFPANADGIVKVANHGPGRIVHPDGSRDVDPEWEGRFRAFMAECLPALADAPVVGSRLCLYCDTFDGNFFVGTVPGHPRLVLATGGSGHGFKFAPVLGDMVADVVEGRPGPARFAWRDPGPRQTEHARHDG